MAEVFIRFAVPVNLVTAKNLFASLDKLLNEGVSKINLLLSSPGGDVNQGVAIFNYLKSLPIEVDTYNLAVVDSVSCVIFSAGRHRYAAPHSRFLIHDILVGVSGNLVPYKQIEEILKTVKSDQENISGIIADATGKTSTEIYSLMQEGSTFLPDEAKSLGLIHDIKIPSITRDSKVLNISDTNVAVPNQFPVPPVAVPFALKPQDVHGIPGLVPPQHFKV